MALRSGRCLLAYYRRKARLKQAELAELMGVTQSMISQIENMSDGLIMSYDFAYNVAIILKCRMEDLYTHVLVLETPKG